MMIREKIVSIYVNVTSMKEALDSILLFVKKKKGSYICVANVHMCMEAFDSERFCKTVNCADLVLPDGRPLSWAQKILGHSNATQVRGPDFMEEICKLSIPHKLNIGLYGGASDAILKEVMYVLSKKYVGINIAYNFSPPFRDLSPEEDVIVVEEINRSDVDVLFVGIGCPKQERWMEIHKNRVNCVMVGVGAAFDFVSGAKKVAPRWTHKIGIEWTFRFFIEPKRLWKRYLKQNPRFLWHFSKQVFSRKILAKF